MDNFISEIDPKIFKEDFPEELKYLNLKLAYPDEFFNGIDDYQKPDNNLKKENFFSKVKNDYPHDKETKRTKKIINYSIPKMEKN